MNRCIRKVVSITIAFLLFISSFTMSVTFASVDYSQAQNISSAKVVTNTTSPSENVFKLANDSNGKEFILLDNDENGDFFILSKDGYGNRAFNKNTSSQEFNPDDTSVATDGQKANIGAWLNDPSTNGFLGAGNGVVTVCGATYDAKLPNGIISMLAEHTWETEPMYNQAEQYFKSAKVSLLSMSELMYYKDKISAAEDNEALAVKNNPQDSKKNPSVLYQQIAKGGWWLRTARGTGTNSYKSSVTGAGAVLMVFTRYDAFDTAEADFGTVSSRDAKTILGIRPTFYLNKDFFKRTRLILPRKQGYLDVSNKIVQLIQSYGREAFPDESVYTAEEKEELFPIGSVKPNAAVQPITYQGDEILAGTVLTGNYIYDRTVTGAETEGASLTEWFAFDDAVTTDTTGRIPLGNEKNYTVKKAQENQYIRFRITPVSSAGVKGDPVLSPPVGPVSESLAAITSPSMPKATTPALTPREYTFTLANNTSKTFILIDSNGKGNSKFFVLSKDFYPARKFSTGTQKFDPNDASGDNIGFYLNNGFRNASDTFPVEIWSNIDNAHVWMTEPGASAAVATSYKTTAGVALLSYTELANANYMPKIGIKDSITAGGWWLRTSHATNAVNNLMLYTSDYNTGPDYIESRAATTATLAVRPAFYLKPDFFKNVKIDLSTMGSEVKKAMLQNYTRSDLSELYTPQELYSMGFYDFDITAQSLTTGGIVLTNENISMVKEITANVTVKAKEKDSDAVLILTVYDDTDRLINIGFGTTGNRVAKGSSTNLMATASGITAGSASYIRLMLWNGVREIQPLTKSIVFPSVPVYGTPQAANEEIQYEILNAQTGRVRVSGTLPGLPEGEEVSVLVLNPGGDFDSLPVQELKSKTQYSGQTTVSGTGNYTIEFTMNAAANETKYEYPVRIGVGGNTYDATLKYFSSEQKTDFVSNVLNQLTSESSDLGAKMDMLYDIFSLSNFKLYQEINNKDAVGSLFVNIKGSTNLMDFDEPIAIFKKAVVLEAFNERKNSLLIGVDGKLSYTDILEFATTKEYAYNTLYASKISSEGMASLHQSLFSKDYTSINEIQDEFERLAIYYSIMKPNGEYGVGYVTNVIEETYNTLKANGLSDKYNSSNKRTVSGEILKNVPEDFSELITMLNILSLQYPATDNNSGKTGSGSGKGSSSGGGGIFPVAMEEKHPEITEVFSDLGDSEWAKESILDLYSRGVLAGKSEGIFAPNDYITREEFIKMLVSALEIKSENAAATVSFQDIPMGHWAYNYVSTAYQAGVIQGINDTEFGVGECIKREDMAVICSRILDKSKGRLNLEDNVYSFTDSDAISEYALESVQMMQKLGIINGNEKGEFMPLDPATRAQAAKIIYCMLQYK